MRFPRQAAVILRARPQEFSVDCLDVVERDIEECPEGAVLVETEYVSCDPYLLLRMRDTFELDAPVPARAVGRVVLSRHPRWAVSDRVWGVLAWQEYVVADAAALRPVDASLLSPTHALSVCGVPGLTAYVGMLEIGGARPGANVVVSGATGAVGSIAAQLAVLAGARVVALVGSAEKASFAVDELGLHDAVVVTGDVSVDLPRALPDGIDIVFENVDGVGLDAALSMLRPSARVVLCGLSARYGGQAEGVLDLMALCGPEASIHGLNVNRHLDRLDEVARKLAARVRAGDLEFREDIVDGIENLPHAFAEMLRGHVRGKRLVRVRDKKGAVDEQA